MPVPKRRHSRSRRDKRRSHLTVKSDAYVLDKETGNKRRSHFADIKAGTHRGKKIA